MPLSSAKFSEQFEVFKRNVLARSDGEAFRSFRHGLPASQEGYKEEVRREALDILRWKEWTPTEVGKGLILGRVIRAIEIDKPDDKLRNNLVRWEPRWGPTNRSHHTLLGAVAEATARIEFERWFIGFFQGRFSDEEAFNRFRALAGKRYDLIAYLFFLKDSDRFMPIAPTRFDEAFRLLGIDLVTKQRCSWENYVMFNDALKDVQAALQDVVSLDEVRLIDAHSFCWILTGPAEKRGATRRGPIAAELELRKGMWQRLLESGGPRGVSPRLLRELGIYGGAQGIWVDKARTGLLTDGGGGITVGLLHTGFHYDDDFTESCVLYHYPNTGRTKGRDANEIEATKACKEHGLPVFVTNKNGSLRDVFFGWVEDWNDGLAEFLVGFGSDPPPSVPVSDEDFVLRAKSRNRKQWETAARANQSKFKFLVLSRYGARCAVCPMTVPQVLQAAHVFEVKHGGSDHPGNGLVLCATHHIAFDRGLFTVEPDSTALIYRANGPGKAGLRIAHDDLRHLTQQPHPQALKARYSRW